MLPSKLFTRPPCGPFYNPLQAGKPTVLTVWSIKGYKYYYTRNSSSFLGCLKCTHIENKNLCSLFRGSKISAYTEKGRLSITISSPLSPIFSDPLLVPYMLFYTFPPGSWIPYSFAPYPPAVPVPVPEIGRAHV